MTLEDLVFKTPVKYVFAQVGNKIFVLYSHLIFKILMFLKIKRNFNSHNNKKIWNIFRIRILTYIPEKIKILKVKKNLKFINKLIVGIYQLLALF
jgi:hypothetical protein